jgi:hypothetical protein
LRGVDAVDQNASGGGLIDAADQIQQRRFSAAARAGYRQKLARVDAQTGVCKSADKTVRRMARMIIIQRKTSADRFDVDDFFHKGFSFSGLLL